MISYLCFVENFTHKNIFYKKFKYGYNYSCRETGCLLTSGRMPKNGAFAGGPFFISSSKFANPFLIQTPLFQGQV